MLTAIDAAREQGARSFGLLAALSLAKLYQSTDRPADAHAVLAPALEGFSPTPEMPEIAEAHALLETLHRRRARSRRRRRNDSDGTLHVAYGNALIAARGYGAPETTAAFARARESALGDKDAPERLAADYGLWAGSFVRGELSAMREHARGLPQRRRGETQFAGGRSRASHSGITRIGSPESTPKRATIWNARSPCSIPARRRSRVSLRTGRGRRGDALSRAGAVAARRHRARFPGRRR